jgi:hypothetical protein
MGRAIGTTQHLESDGTHRNRNARASVLNKQATANTPTHKNLTPRWNLESERKHAQSHARLPFERNHTHQGAHRKQHTKKKHGPHTHTRKSTLPTHLDFTHSHAQTRLNSAHKKTKPHGASDRNNTTLGIGRHTQKQKRRGLRSEQASNGTHASTQKSDTKMELGKRKKTRPIARAFAFSRETTHIREHTGNNTQKRSTDHTHTHEKAHFLRISISHTHTHKHD